MPLIEELRRRNVFRVAAAYLVVGWLLTEVLTTILPELGAPDWAPRAVILIFAFGFIPAVVLSWVYELTPDGIKREGELENDSASKRKRAKTFDFVTIGAIVVLIVVLALFGARQGAQNAVPLQPAIRTASVAVLPFVNLSTDADNEYFSDGLTETLLHMLTQVPDLQVAARTSSFAFKGQRKTIREIARTLQVAHVLEGSVQRDGDRVRVTAQLIRAEDGFHVWSEVYDRTLDDIFAIQDEIAGRVGSALSASLLPSSVERDLAGVTTTAADAYDLYLQARSERATFSYGGLQASEDLLKGALTIDPDFVEAKTELAYNYLSQAETGLMTGEHAVVEIRAITDQVLAADPDTIGARAVRLFADTMLETKGGDAQAMFAAIEELQPMVGAAPADLRVRTLLVRLLKGTKQLEQALTVMLAAVDLDPLNAQIHYELGSIYGELEQSDKARAALEKSLEIEPAQPNAYAILAELGLYDGNGVEFMRQFLNAIRVDPKDHELPGMIAEMLYKLELVEEGDDFRARVLAIAPASEIAYRIELLRAIAVGDEEAGIVAARRAIEADVEDRRFAFAGAVQHLLRTAIERGTLEQEIAYLEEHVPGLLDVDNENSPLKHRAAQYTAFDAWYTMLTPAELDEQIRKMIQIAESFGQEPMEDAETRVAVYALRGQTDEAVETALRDVFTETVAMHLNWEQDLSQGQYADVVADPRVQAAMERWAAEEERLREAVRAYLADVQASG